MKIVCECGNEGYFSKWDTDGTELNYTEDKGQYVIEESNGKGFMYWQSHDIVGIVCENCGKDIWMFV